MKITQLVVALLFGGLTASAYAGYRPQAVFDFSNLTANGGGTSFIPSETLNAGYWQCSGGDLCSSDLAVSPLGGDLKYTMNGITVTATATYKGGQATVVQDHENNYDPLKEMGAGLGVYHTTNDTSDDNITNNETLTLTFSEAVALTGINLRSEGHNVSFSGQSSFLFNGAPLPLAGTLGFGRDQFTGTTFTFAYGGDSAKQFYLGGVTVISAVPENETWAMMVGGLGLLGFAARRRRTDTQLG
ncbi:MAG: hypothetical protein ACI9ZF_001345 [Bradyrhizobium sp.]|jgi:hypothetical protein